METEGYLGLTELRQRALDQKKPFDYDQRDRRHARASTATRCRFTLKEPRPRFARPWRAATFTARSRARWSSSTAPRSSAPGGHGPVQARAVAAQLAHRLRDATPTSARCSTTPSRPPAMPRARRCSRASRAAVCRWSTASRSRSSRRSSRAGSSFVNGEADVAYRVGYQFAPQAMPNGKVAPNLAKKGHPRAIRSSRRPATTSCSTWTIRWSAATPPAGRAAPGDQPGPRHRGRSSTTPTWASARWRRPDAAAHLRLRREAEDRERRLRPGARAGPARPLRLSSTSDGDGWRERPDGSPLVLRVSTQTAGARPQDLRSAEQEHEGARHPDPACDRAMAGEPEGGARRQPTRCGRSAARRRARFERRLPEIRQPADRRPEHGDGSGCRRSTSSTTRSRPARRAGAAGSLSRGRAARRWPTCPTSTPSTASRST